LSKDDSGTEVSLEKLTRRENKGRTNEKKAESTYLRESLLLVLNRRQGRVSVEGVTNRIETSLRYLLVKNVVGAVYCYVKIPICTKNAVKKRVLSMGRTKWREKNKKWKQKNRKNKQNKK
jgi:hypothetical protein